MKNNNVKSMNLHSLSKQGLVQMVVGLQASIKQLQTDLLRCQVMAATRLDVIRLLGYIMNRDPSPDPVQLSMVTPMVPEVKKIMAGELNDLAVHLRTRADEFEKVSARLIQEVDKEPEEEKKVKE